MVVYNISEKKIMSESDSTGQSLSGSDSPKRKCPALPASDHNRDTGRNRDGRAPRRGDDLGAAPARPRTENRDGTSTGTSGGKRKLVQKISSLPAPKSGADSGGPALQDSTNEEASSADEHGSASSTSEEEEERSASSSADDYASSSEEEEDSSSADDDKNNKSTRRDDTRHQDQFRGAKKISVSGGGEDTEDKKVISDLKRDGVAKAPDVDVEKEHENSHPGKKKTCASDKRTKNPPSDRSPGSDSDANNADKSSGSSDQSDYDSKGKHVAKGVSFKNAKKGGGILKESQVGTENLTGHPLFETYCRMPEGTEKTGLLKVMLDSLNLCKTEIAKKNREQQPSGAQEQQPSGAQEQQPSGAPGKFSGGIRYAVVRRNMLFTNMGRGTRKKCPLCLGVGDSSSSWGGWNGNELGRERQR